MIYPLKASCTNFNVHISSFYSWQLPYFPSLTYFISLIRSLSPFDQYGCGCQHIIFHETQQSYHSFLPNIKNYFRFLWDTWNTTYPFFFTKYSQLFQILMIVMFCEHFFPKGYYIPFLQKQIFFTSAKALFLSELLELSSSFCLPVEKLVSRDFEKNPTDRQTNPIISSFLVLIKQHL